VHDRTPLLFPSDRVDAWLDPTSRIQTRCMRCWPGSSWSPLEGRRISPAVNNVRNNSADLLKPGADDADRPLELALAA
jgi:putative SOS response-associated peptidase YedK